jgi:hypothetical protein
MLMMALMKEAPVCSPPHHGTCADQDQYTQSEQIGEIGLEIDRVVMVRMNVQQPLSLDVFLVEHAENHTGDGRNHQRDGGNWHERSVHVVGFVQHVGQVSFR